MHLRNKNPLLKIVFNKFEMSKFFDSKNIIKPNKLYTGDIKDFDFKILENNSTVIKTYKGCSNRGITIITYNNTDDTYFSYFDKKSFSYEELIKIIKERYTKNILVEQKLGNAEGVPIDIKILCYKGKIKEVHFLKQGKIIEQSIYSCILENLVTEEYFCKKRFKKRITNDNLLDELDCDIKSILSYGQEVLNKLDNEHLYRIDCYYYNKLFYIGEITIGPGSHYFLDITPKFLRLLFDDLFV